MNTDEEKKDICVNPEQWNSFWSKHGSSHEAHISFSKKRILKIIDPYIVSGQKALDAGCGSGFFAGYFCARGMQTVAVDFSQSALEKTKQVTRGKATVLKTDLLAQDLSSQIGKDFDIIFTDGLFEHFSAGQQDRILQNFQSVLANNGKIITFVPNKNSPWQWIRPLYMPGIEEKPFTIKELIIMNQRNGLKVIASGGVNVLPIQLSPDNVLGSWWGMLLYSIAEK